MNRRGLTDDQIREELEKRYVSPIQSGDEGNDSNSESDEEYVLPQTSESDSEECSDIDKDGSEGKLITIHSLF